MIGFPHKLILVALAPNQLKTLRSGVQLYDLTAPFTYESGALGPLTVPPGFRTDFASIPRLAWAWIDPEDPVILFASIIHDWLYSCAGCLPDGRRATRAQADAVLREAMLASHARRDQAAIVHAAVRLFGARHWGK